ncbi:MAG: F0F1 ATP synthase subunit delta [Patescibacteria group bacterium]|nr:F0F1 ATP synthase subunit delta [Patescibacteria group bacterium]
MATISINNIASAIYQASKDKSGKDLDDVLKNSTILLSKKHLLGKSPQILEAIDKLIDKREGIIEAKISSKEKLNKIESENLENIIKSRYKAKSVQLTFTEDPSLLGGIKIEVGDEVIDMTLKNKLDKLKDYLTTN